MYNRAEMIRDLAALKENRYWENYRYQYSLRTINEKQIKKLDELFMLKDAGFNVDSQLKDWVNAWIVDDIQINEDQFVALRQLYGKCIISGAVSVADPVAGTVNCSIDVGESTLKFNTVRKLPPGSKCKIVSDNPTYSVVCDI